MEHQNEEQLIQKEIKHSGERVSPIFTDLNADNEDQQPTKIESLCMNCHEMVSRLFALL